MRSPFPGMNPYLEQADVWHDFHQRLIPCIANELTASIRPKYLATIDENVYVHEVAAEKGHRLGRPDVAVLAGQLHETSTTAVAGREAPVYSRLFPTTDIEREPFIEIRDRQSRELVTVIEVLGPTNKMTGPDRDQYISKRRRILASSVHLVEIDLLRGGPRMPVEKLPACDYVVMVSRYEERPRVGLWPLLLKTPLPEIPIPLRNGDADAMLDLQSLLLVLYDAAGYEDYIYESSPSPPLVPADGKWAEEIIALQNRSAHS